MTAWSGDDVREIMTMLADDDPQARAAALREIAANPSGDAAVRAASESLLDDRTPCVLQVPLRFGELRLLAAHALAAERAAADLDAPVQLRDVPQPLTLEQLGALAEAANLRGDGEPPDRQLRLFAALRAEGKLPTTVVRLGPS